ncbi:layilin isoform X1 [Ovis aries]|uniref:Layilin n=2 Tax=Ovis aries TaxID=9940 RepID=A0AC11E2L2_SHEEP|nr:layilin isoform X1 [Ovis aries]
MPRGAAPRAVLLAALLAGLRGATGRLLSGQPVCRLGTQKPCYEVIYFRDASQRLNFEEARAACRRNGSQLVSIESEDEQRLIVKFIENLLASDGDFWIGLRRREDQQSNGTACQDLYAWIDGSTAAFRNWYVDEPSCGSEVCVVMYHQPSAPAGIGGPYMFQWNDDRCTMKNNFICKYSDGFKERREGMVLAEPREILESRKRSHPTGAVTRQHVKSNQEPKDKGAPGHIPRDKPTVPSTRTGGEETEPATPILPEDTEKEDTTEILKESKEAALNLAYILIPSILLLLLVVTTGVCWVWICRRRKRGQPDPSTKEQRPTWPALQPGNSPDLEVYNVIRKQSEADLAETRPDLKNISFRARSGEATPDAVSCDYENVAVNPSESGFVTLASMESGFVTNDVYEFSPGRAGRSKESGWVENEIYGY